MASPTQLREPGTHGAPARNPLTGQSQPAWRRWLRQVRSRSVLLPVVAALVAFVGFLAVTADDAETVQVLVADRDLPPGTEIGRGDVRIVDVPVSKGVTERILGPGDLEDDMVLVGPVSGGDPLLAAAVSTVEESQRAVSVPVPKTRAVGGDIHVGDRVDLVTIDADGSARYVLRNTPVLAVPSTGGEDGVLVRNDTTDWYLTVAVPDGESALAVAEAVEAGNVQVVRVPPDDPTADQSSDAEDDETDTDPESEEGSDESEGEGG